MKKFFTAALAIAVMAGCTKNEIVVSESPREITFQTISTKAVSGFSEANHFFSFAYYLENGKTWDANKADAVEYLKNAEISYDTANNCWKNSTTSYYWPKAGTLTFFAWSDNTPSPSVSGATVSCDTDGICIPGYSIKENVNKDLLVADIAKDQNSNTTTFEGNSGIWKQGVLTKFRHIQSYLLFNVKTQSDYNGVTFKVKSITLNGVEVKKDYFQAAGWSSNGTKVTDNIPAFTGDTTVTNTGVDLVPATDDYKYVLPQDFDDSQKLKIEYTITTNYGVEAVQNVSVEKALKDLYPNNWEAGKKYTLTISMGLEEILWAPDVVDWEVGTVNGINI